MTRDGLGGIGFALIMLMAIAVYFTLWTSAKAVDTEHVARCAAKGALAMLAMGRRVCVAEVK